MTESSLPNAVLWDWDGTLADGWPAIGAGLNAAFSAFGMPEWSPEEVKARVRHSLRDSFPALFGPDWPRARDLFYAGVRARHLDVLRPMPGARAALDALAASGVPTAVVSNKSGPLLRAEADALGWTPRFRALVGAGDARADKPDRAPLRVALAACGAPASPRIWYIGDTALDVAAARAAGLRAVLVLGGAGDAADGVGADEAVADLDALASDVLRRSKSALDRGRRMG